jgi:MoxR-like ATPase
VVEGTDVRESIQRVLDNIEKVIVGKKTPIEQCVVALLCNGHALIEDVPGVGKTMLAQSLSRSTACDFKRIQFTPDLLPSDITGVTVYNQKTGDFEFHPGPVSTQILLADEINRATPKTQSALLEAMEEHQVTVDGVTRAMPQPFMVMATQNPIEYEGTFPLPEGQLDRFLLRITLGYPAFDDEVAIMERQQISHPIESLEPVISPEGIREAQRKVREIQVDPLVKHYIVALVEATRKHDDAGLGASPRGSLSLFRTCQAQALIQGRDFVLPDDVKAMAVPALAHRIIVAPHARIRGVTGRDVVEAVLEEVPVPGLRSGGRLPGQS